VKQRVMVAILITLGFQWLLSPAGAWAQPRWRIVDAEEVTARSAAVGGASLEFLSNDGRRVAIGLDPGRMEISNPAATDEFHPLDAAVAQRILSQMDEMPASKMGITIYLLPGLPETEMRSFCVGSEVFIAAALDEWPLESAAYTLAHEVGHAVQHLGLPGRSGPGWRRYLELRSLTDASVHSEQSPHRDRPGEIFAEDFRLLFGGPLAAAGGVQENPLLPPPSEVDGLSRFFAEVLELKWAVEDPGVTARNLPNPFNPATVIQLDLREELVAAGTPVRLQVFDLRGRMVRDFGLMAPAPQIRVRWDGTDQRGAPLASGRYIYRVWVGGHTARGSMILLK